MQNNGRVNINGPITSNNVFKLYDRIPINEKMSNYKEALIGNIEKNTLSDLFFSSENITIIQNAIRYKVYTLSNNQYLIGPQNQDTLKIIMRSMYLQNQAYECTDITNTIESLNKRVVEYCVPKLIGEAEGYLKYKRDIGTLATPMRRPISTYHSNTLERKEFI